MGTIRSAAAATRKRASPPPTASRDGGTPADRIAIQFDLAWTADYTGLVTGEVNEKATAAVKTFQRNRKFKETGVLNTQERALLAAASKAWEDAAEAILAQFEDQDVSYVDATSFTVMRNLRLTSAFAFDHHFSVAGFHLVTQLPS